MKNKVKFNSFSNGTAVLLSNTPYTYEEVVKELLASKDGEWSPGYYRFVLID